MKTGKLTFGTVLAMAMGLPAAAFADQYISPEGLIYELDESSLTAIFCGIDSEKSDALTKLLIPGTVDFEGKAFMVEGVESYSCYGNRAIKSVEFGEGVSRIGSYAFSSCSELTSVKFSEGVTEIGTQSFYNCTKISSLDFPSTLTTIDDFAFFYLPLLEEVTLPASVSRLGSAPFGDCPSLRSIVVEEGNKNYASLDGVLFTKDMTRLINYPIGDGKESYTMPASVTVVGANSMRNNVVMTEISLSPALTTIEAGAFNYCAVTSFTIPAGVSMIGASAFAGNSSLVEFVVDPSNKWYCSDGGMLLTKDKKVLLVGVSQATINIPEGVEEISESAFYRLPAIRTVNFSSTVKTVGKSAFSTCTNLTSLNISTGVETIGLQAFYKCTALRSLTLPASLRYMDSAAFASCTELRTVRIEEGLESAAASVFQGCTSLEKINIPGTMTEVAEAMFYGCMTLGTCVLGEGVEWIGDSAFSSCIALKSINFPSTLTAIGNYAFNAAGLKSVEFPEGLETIGEGAFENCTFPEVHLPSSVQIIGNLSFAWNSGLKSFSSGSGLRQMGSYALLKGESLTEVEIAEGLENVGACAFGACPVLETLTLPSTVTVVGSQAFAETTAMKEIIILAQNPPATDGPLYDEFFNGYQLTKLIVAPGCLEAYQSAPEWSNFYNIGIAESVAELAGPEPVIVEIVDAAGIHRPELGEDLNIIRMSDGSIRKQMGR